MKLLAIDQSLSSTGVVLFDTEHPTCHIADCVLRSDKDRDDADRIVDVVAQILVLCKTHSVDAVAFEALPFGAVSTSVRVLAGLYYHLGITLKAQGIPFTTFPPTTIKKTAGNGRFDKQGMFNALPTYQKSTFTDAYLATKGRYDVTDAYWIGVTYMKDVLKCVE